MERAKRGKSYGRLAALLALLAGLILLAPQRANVSLAAEQETSTIVLPREVRKAYMPAIHAAQASSPTHCIAGAAGESDNVSNAIQVCNGQTITGYVSEQDTDDVYRIHLVPGERLTLTLIGSGPDADVFVYPPRTVDVIETNRDHWVKTSNSRGSHELLDLTADRSGYWYIDVYAFAGSISYTLSITVN